MRFETGFDRSRAPAYLQRIADAFTDLADALGFARREVSAEGILPLRLGARWRMEAWAKFSGRSMTIMVHEDLRAGIAHEYGHFLDHYLGALLLSGRVVAHAYRLSDITDPAHAPTRRLPLWEAWREVVDEMYREVPVRTVDARPMDLVPFKWAHLDRLVERFHWDVDAALRALAAEDPTRHADLLETCGHVMCELVRRRGIPAQRFTVPARPSRFYCGSADDPDYRGSAQELFARAFTAYVADNLAVRGRHNFLLAHAPEPPDALARVRYPAGEERRRINRAINHLLETIRHSGVLRADTRESLT